MALSWTEMEQDLLKEILRTKGTLVIKNPDNIGLLKTLSPDVLQHIRELVFRGLGLVEVPELPYIPTVLTLNFERNRLKGLPEDLPEKFPFLTCLILSRNELEKIPECVKDFKYLVEFHADHNEIEEIPEWFYFLSGLETLSLEGNLIDSLDEAVGGLEPLTYLNLSINNLRALPESLGKLKNLERLEVESNNLTHVPKALESLNGTLRWVSLKDNFFSEEPEFFKTLGYTRRYW